MLEAYQIAFNLRFIFTPKNKLCFFKMSCQVFIRAKPADNYYFTTDSDNTISLPTNKDIVTYKFDKVFKPGSSSEIYHSSCKPLVDQCLLGFNCTLLTYGQSGAGKSFTLEGLIHNCATELILLTDLVEFSVCEIYNDESRDLLNSNTSIKELKNLKKITISTIASFSKIMIAVQNNKEISATLLNSVSSRSHILYCFTISKGNRKSRIVLGDLAGSENSAKAGTLENSDRMSESKHINKSLLQIGNVINSISKNASFVQYRNSKLTHILKYNLSKNCYISLILCISSDKKDWMNTRNTLAFGSVANKIICRPIANSPFVQVIRSNSKRDMIVQTESSSDLLRFDQYKLCYDLARLHKVSDSQMNTSNSSLFSDSELLESFNKSLEELEENISLFSKDLDIVDYELQKMINNGLVEEFGYLFKNYELCTCMKGRKPKSDQFLDNSDIYENLKFIYTCTNKHKVLKVKSSPYRLVLNWFSDVMYLFK